jgi:hypothetical protein
MEKSTMLWITNYIRGIKCKNYCKMIPSCKPIKIVKLDKCSWEEHIEIIKW